MEELNKRYPEISEKGKEDAIKIIESFKKTMEVEAKKAIQDIYCDILPYIETDAWGNFRNSILDDLCDYRENSIKFPYDYKRIRQSIYNENKEQIIKDLNKDLLEDIESLNEQLKRAWEFNS